MADRDQSGAGTDEVLRDPEVRASTCVAGLLASLLILGVACSDAPSDRIVFVSSTTHTGDLGGIEGADELCQMLAEDVGLEGTFMAWLSDDAHSPAIDFTRSSGRYVLVDGTVVADDWSDLTDGTLDHAIDLDEAGAPGPATDDPCDTESNAWVMTGTSEYGTWAGPQWDCSGWTSESAGSLFGRMLVEDRRWTFGCIGKSEALCANEAALYCFEQ